MLFAYLLAEDTSQTGPGFGGMMVPILLMVLLFYFVVWMPNRKQEKVRQAMIAAVKKNDKIINTGGIIGVVESVKEENEVILKGGLRITKSSISQVIPEEVAREQKKEGGA